ncbi:MAG TPA: hypothetical protein VHJ78_11200 [Actinomycetota bacterium]|nr:hypothetical protein [Actinomycetota bacterium]
MARPRRLRLAAVLLTGLLAAGSSAGAVRADEGPHDDNIVAPSPTTQSGHEHEVERPEMTRTMAAGNARRYVDGQKATYRMRVTQRLQPKGPHPADPQTSSMDLLLTETVTEDRDGPLVTLAVTEASAEGFLAEAEERSALERKVRFRPQAGSARLVLRTGPGGEPDLLDLDTVAPFGQFGHIRMVDLALRAHLLNPVLPSANYRDGQSFQDSANLPAGWSLGAQVLTGSLTVVGRGERSGKPVVHMKGTHVSTDNLLRVRAIDNAVDALQGKAKPVPNDFFAGTIFNALFPKGSTYESLTPPLPLRPQAPAARRNDPAPRRRRRPRRGRGLVLAAIVLVGLSACSDPRRNVDVVSLNLTGPLQVTHETVLDRGTGVVLSSEVTASARLEGKMHLIPEELVPHLSPQVAGLSQAPIGMDADWTVTQELEGPLPAVSAAARLGGPATIAAAVAIAMLVAAALLVRRSRRAKAGVAGSPEPAPQPEPAPVE